MSYTYKHVIVIGIDGAGNFDRNSKAPFIRKMFAEGAATGTPARRMISRVTAQSGQRTATVDSPAVVRLGTVGLAGSTMVRGPGQNFSASR